jgi:hypothetical protein
MAFINEFYLDVIRMIVLLFGPLLFGAAVLTMVLILFAIVGPAG